MAHSKTRLTIDFTFRLIQLLRKNDIPIGTQQTLKCIRSIFLFETINQKQLLTIYKLTLINRKEDVGELFRLYDQLLKRYMNSGGMTDSDAIEIEKTINPQSPKLIGGEDDDDELEEELRAGGYSKREILHHKDFRFFDHEEEPSITTELKQIARKYATISKRKMKQANSPGKIDLRKSIRKNIKYGGEILTWQYKKRIPTHSRFVALIDVSGSMDVYSHFFLKFLHLLHSHNQFKIETFVFSTELLPLTSYFKLKDFQHVLDHITHHFSAWSGGTKIGKNIEGFNKTYSSFITPKTTVIIMSDGWDTGDIDLLKNEMSILHNRAKSVVWMNPLKGDPSYEPLAAGMATALPYCDEFISCHNIDSLKELAKLLT